MRLLTLFGANATVVFKFSRAVWIVENSSIPRDYYFDHAVAFFQSLFQGQFYFAFSKGDRNEAPYGCEKPFKYLFRFSMETSRLAVALETTSSQKREVLLLNLYRGFCYFS